MERLAHNQMVVGSNGLVIRAMGDTIGLCPPLIINAAEIDELLGLFARTLRQVEDRLAPRVAAPPLAIPRSRQ